MSITKHDRPVYNLTCDECDYVCDEDDGGILRFDSIEGARMWASDSGWGDNQHWPNPRMTCPACEGKAVAAADEHVCPDGEPCPPHDEPAVA